MQVVAEGAETFEQVEYLRTQKCQQVQGFYYSPAIPLQQLPRFLQQLRLQRREPLFS
jgi:EAL domain-containing protein (putative c-di-GMP-specific phosphodiesterase class I)